MNSGRAIRTLSVALLIAVFIMSAAQVSATPTFSEIVVAGGPVMIGSAPIQVNPEFDGRYIVYERTPGVDSGLLDTDIRAYDVGTGQTISISDREGDDDADQISPDVSIDTVVYQSYELLHPNIFLHNITWSNTRQVTNVAHAQTGPRISGNHILWHDGQTDALKFYPVTWPQYMNQQIPGTVGVYQGSWDIDGDTVVFARKHGAGDFTFYEWKLFSDAVPQAFATHEGAVDIADVRLHNNMITYTYGAGLNSLGIRPVAEGQPLSFADGWRDGDVFHDMLAFEIVADNDVGVFRNGEWNTAFGTPAQAETNPSVFGHRVAFERDTYNGDIILATASEPLVDRTAGANRYATAVAVSEEYFPFGADNVVLCTGENFPDALAAAPWARFLEGPVLLTRGSSVPQVVMDEIERLGAKSVWIIGGESAVSSAVKTQLEAEGLYVDRQLQGVNRYETSAKIAYFLYDALAADGRPFSNKAFVARGDAFPDALAVAPLAAATYSPIILVRTDAPVPSASAQVFQTLPIWYAFIVGGTDVVSEDVEVAIETWTTANLGMGSPATRYAGADRYATAAVVLQDGVAMGWVDLDTVGFATGVNFPDALGGGAALGSYGSPLLLTRQGSLPGSVSAVLEQRAAEIGRADVFGGSDVVSDAVKGSITDLLR